MDGRVLLPDGTPLFNLEHQCTAPIRLGYQLVNFITGRLLPTTTRNRVYTAWAATEVMGKVAVDMPIIDIFEYEMKPIYDFERPDNCVLVRSLYDGMI